MGSVDEFRRVNTRKASIVHIGGFRPTGDPQGSHFGLRPLALPDEMWPGFQGKPLLFVCQLNLTHAPAVPELLKDIKLLTFFVSEDDNLHRRQNGEAWRLRAYKSLDGMVPLDCPTGTPRIKRGFECRWELCDDQPVYDDPDIIVPAGLARGEVHLDNIKRTKVGGYASNIQSAPWWGDGAHESHPAKPKYCWQVDTEDKVALYWGDAGTIYLARGTSAGFEDNWYLDTQCY